MNVNEDIDHEMEGNEVNKKFPRVSTFTGNGPTVFGYIIANRFFLLSGLPEKKSPSKDSAAVSSEGGSTIACACNGTSWCV